MSGIDLIIVAVIVISAIISGFRGFVKEAVSLIVWIAAIVITLLLTSRFATLLPKETIDSPVARLGISAVVLFLGSMLIGSLINWLVQRMISSTRLSKVDRLVGTGFGIVRGAVIVALVVLLANLVPSLKAETWWRESRLLPPLQSIAKLIHTQLPQEVAQHFDFTPAT